MAGDLALASYHDLKGKMIMQVNMKKGNGKNSITSKQFNRGLIFQLIATGTCNTRIELSRRTGLAKTTVTNIVAEFMEKGIVKECEEELTEVCGRNPIILKVADQAPKIIGILVFRTNIQAVLCSLDMQIFRTETIEFGELTGDILIQNAFELIDRMMEEEKNILGIGIASIGPVDIRNGIILNPPRFYGVKHVPIKEAIQKKYNLPVYFDHDNNCAALAEKLFGIGKAEQDFLLLAVSNGIGSGFVCGGEVFHSHRGFETELGHVSINCKGLQCSCGNRGCLEMYASSYVVREKLKKITGLNLPYADYFKIHDRPEVEDILEAGIRIIAQPPGKKLQNMMQLSGGEKALTAIALLFAIQNLKPSPFCLLDEIEAALDDNNVDRFAQYLHKLTKYTQFIVITHRRGTMTAADRLYGITMQEKGVSTLVSVSLLENELDK